MSSADTNSPLILGIETATRVCGAALTDGSGIRGEALLDTGLSHSSKLVQLVSRVLADTSTELSDIDAVSVSVGPGSFTGIRIGIGTALGLAVGADLPLIPVPTLDALAWAQRPFRGLLCAFVDARRAEVYYCLYRADWGEIDRLTDYVVQTPAAMLAEVDRSARERQIETAVLLAGPETLLRAASAGMTAGSEGLLQEPPSGAVTGSKSLPRESPTGSAADSSSQPPSPLVVGQGPRSEDAVRKGTQALVAAAERSMPKPSAVAALGVELYRKGKAGGPEGVKPIYVRRSDAELGQKRKPKRP